MKKATLKEIAELIAGGNDFVVTGHVEPDPDCLGSMGALYLALNSMGKRVCIVLPGAVSDSLLFIPGIRENHEPAGLPFDQYTAIVLDCDPDRTGNAREVVEQAYRVINIDHHVTNRGQGDVTYFDPEAAATGEIIYSLLTLLPVRWSKEISTALYAAIFGDTGSFSFSNTTARTFQIVGDLVAKGAEPNFVAREIQERKPLNYVRLIAACLNTLQVSEDGKVAWMKVTRDMLADHCLNPGEVEGLVKYPRMIDGVEVALLFREENSHTKVGFRSNSDVDVSEIAHSFGGGGHMRAAGCTIESPIVEVIPAVLNAVNERVSRLGKEGRPL